MGQAAEALAGVPDLPSLTRVDQVRKLTPQEASRGYPVHLTAVLTLFDPARYLYFVQDDSAGIYVEIGKADPVPQLRPKMVVQIDGSSSPGDYAPIVMAQKIIVMGEGALPPAAEVTFKKIMTGSYDSQWVSLKGVIRNQLRGEQTATLELYAGDGLVKVIVTGAVPESDPGRYVGAEVEVQGVCRSLFDDHRRLQSVEVEAPGWEQVRLVGKRLPAPFSLPVEAVTSLLQFAPGTNLHQRRLIGIVTLARGDGSFYLQDAGGAVLVHPTTITNITAGEAADVVGFPVLAEKRLVLENAIVRPTKSTNFLEPADLKPESLLDESLQGTLVRCKGRVLGHFSRANQEWLTFQLGSSLIDVILDKKSPADSLENILPGTLVRLTGVYVPQLSEAGNPQGFKLLLRTAADVRILSVPSWWTLRHLASVLSGVLVVLVLGLGWVHALRRQVAQRTGELHAEIEQHKRTEARLESEILERQKMQAEVARSHRDLLSASRLAGMAEVATSVLHNVGNVLNSVNVSVHLIAEHLRESKLGSFQKAAEMLRKHEADLPTFLTAHPKGSKIPGFLVQLAGRLRAEQDSVLKEVDGLEKNLDHIKRIIATQQTYARAVGVVEQVHPADLIEDALRITGQSLAEHQVTLVRQIAPDLPKISVDKHKALQVLINLLRNARKACQESNRPDKQVTVAMANGEGTLKISVSDNGVGIAPENLTRIFSHGFTTRKDGHGFGLHSGALAAKEMGGCLRVESDGPGKGASFTLELPVED